MYIVWVDGTRINAGSWHAARDVVASTVTNEVARYPDVVEQAQYVNAEMDELDGLESSGVLRYNIGSRVIQVGKE